MFKVNTNCFLTIDFKSYLVNRSVKEVWIKTSSFTQIIHLFREALNMSSSLYFDTSDKLVVAVTVMFMCLFVGHLVWPAGEPPVGRLHCQQYLQQLPCLRPGKPIRGASPAGQPRGPDLSPVMPFKCHRRPIRGKSLLGMVTWWRGSLWRTVLAPLLDLAPLWLMYMALRFWAIHHASVTTHLDAVCHSVSLCGNVNG